MSNDEIRLKKHLGMLEFMMKHIHQRDMIKLWDSFLEMFQHVIFLDKEKGFIYVKYFLYYTDAKLPQEKQADLAQVLNKYLSEEEKDKIMRTVARKYIEEGEAKGKFEGIKIGEVKGEAKLLKMMLVNGNSIEEIARITKLPVSRIFELLKVE
ncbi:MAG: Rpn family recombination-promoting nuclease/putative transposase [Amoebophilaceae bacterium]|nr:Rpn family recombination-promoting nuclease/putative transposase [Amoebophilaceae bacterium]